MDKFLRNSLAERLNCYRDSDKLSDAEKNYYIKMTNEMSELDAPMALYDLSNFLFKYYGKKVRILLDEYDTPMQEAYVYGYWKELVDFTRSMFNATFKTNHSLERAIMTGITRISPPQASLGSESIFSDLNHLKVVTTTSNEYADSFGFTEKEVFASMDEFGYEEKEKVKQWYDGFVFGDKKDIYNPWSILNYLDTRKFKSYWANILQWFRSAKTEYNDFVKALLFGDVKAMNHYMNRVALKTFSYFDTGKQPSQEEPERFYHGFAFEGKKVLIG